MGGQTALNMAIQLEKKGILKKYKVELIGANSKAISNAEDRKKFRKCMREINIDLPKSEIVTSIKKAKKALKKIGLPAIIRPAFTLGGSGSGIAYRKKEYYEKVNNGLTESPENQVLIEECLEGWKEFEMEVVRDKNDNCIIICSIENVDPMGTHTGDSITVAPALTLTDKEYQIMRNASISCLRKIGVETGGSNVQFAINPKDGRMVIIEMNPRVSRSSALASKATGFPIAKIATKLAVGYTLDELTNDITKSTPASFEPTIDYVVTKIPRFTFEKFQKTEAILGTTMKSVGEAMAIGRNFKESLQKALVSLETGLEGLDRIDNLSKNTIIKKLGKNTPNKILLIAEAIRNKINPNKICGPYIWSFITRFGFFRTMSPEKICDPSRGGMGIILNIASIMLIWVNKYSIRMRDPPTICARIIVPPTNANNRFAAGPAKATFIISVLGFFRYRASTGTGFAYPKPIIRIINDPIGSRCANGFNVNLPDCFAVGSPSLYATQAWANS